MWLKIEANMVVMRERRKRRTGQRACPCVALSRKASVTTSRADLPASSLADSAGDEGELREGARVAAVRESAGQ